MMGYWRPPVTTMFSRSQKGHLNRDLLGVRVKPKSSESNFSSAAGRKTGNVEPFSTELEASSPLSRSSSSTSSASFVVARYMGAKPNRDQKILLSWIMLAFFLNFQPLASIPPVSAEYTYYEHEDYTFANLNCSYVDQSDGQTKFKNFNDAGKFGSGRVETVLGVVVQATSLNHTRFDACQPLDTDTIPQGEPWIALVQYGTCGEATKLKNVQNGNASAVLVYSDKVGHRVIKMNYKAHIVTVFISKDKTEELLTLLDNGTRVMMQINIGKNSPFRLANINRTSVLFVSISFIILMIISLAWLVFYYVQRFRYIHAKDLLARRLCSAAKKALDKIPVKTVRAGDKEAEGDFECCAVCIEPFKVGEVVRTLPCKHSFHKSCVDPWLLEQRSCPMCKMDILKYYGLVFTGSQESVLNLDDADLHPHHGQAEVEITHHVPLYVHLNQVDSPSHHYPIQSPINHSLVNGNSSTTGSSSGTDEDRPRHPHSPSQPRSPLKAAAAVSRGGTPYPPSSLLTSSPTFTPPPQIVTSAISVIEGNLISPLGVPSATAILPPCPRDSPVIPPQQTHHRRWGSAPPGAPVIACPQGSNIVDTFGSGGTTTNLGLDSNMLSPAAFCAIDLTGSDPMSCNQGKLGSLETLATSPNQIQIGKKLSLPSSDLGLHTTPPLAHHHM